MTSLAEFPALRFRVLLALSQLMGLKRSPIFGKDILIPEQMFQDKLMALASEEEFLKISQRTNAVRFV